MRLQKEKWTFRNLEEVHRAANAVLRFAMFNERSKRWPKVAESYKRLIWLVDKTHFPKDYEPPQSYAILMYELHYHLGVALQRLEQHRKAIGHFTKAIQSVSIPKGGCLAGCVANSCLMTPILARRAFAFAKVGDMKSALRDAENSVVLDNQNPDVYCIRALVRGTRDEETMALRDVDEGLKLNPSHVCALIIRGALSRTLAEKLNPESQSFYTVTDFHHPCILDFYDRFLFTLSVPHTITDINLTPDKPSQKQLDSNPDLYSRGPSRVSSAHSSSSTREALQEAAEPFRCGTPASADNKSAARRRKDYGEAVRKFMARPKTASEFLAQLEKDRTKRSLQEQQQARRASSAVVPRANLSQQSAHTDLHLTTPSVTPFSRKSSASQGAGTGRTVTSPPLLAPYGGGERVADRGSFRSELSSRPGVRLDVETKTSSGRTTKTTCTKTFTFHTPSNYSIPVFQPVNIKGAPRMYYRPWRGDKLPIADVPHPESAPAFY
ncbi:uncharacterized protein LOC143284780 isoform X2 [Babylonia areolata]|uniref:uncharacterized protein LOC143284780 isoform X2 n=1 Tax=Babylonia areolata TaxID=304850 RepID=UPI003FD17718